MLVHDISDIPIDLTKMFNFLKLRLPTAVGFVVLVASWVYWRMFVYPFYVIRSCYADTPASIFSPKLQAVHLPVKVTFILLLSSLAVLHCYWFTLFVRMGYLLAAKYELHDMSAYKGGEKDEHDRRGGLRDRSGSMSEHELAGMEAKGTPQAMKME